MPFSRRIRLRIGVIDVGNEDRPPLGRDPPREAPPDRDPDALLDLLLDPFAARARSTPARSSSSRKAAVSLARIALIRSSSSCGALVERE